jgi:hypothetical protein
MEILSSSKINYQARSSERTITTDALYKCGSAILVCSKTFIIRYWFVRKHLLEFDNICKMKLTPSPESPIRKQISMEFLLALKRLTLWIICYITRICYLLSCFSTTKVDVFRFLE